MLPTPEAAPQVLPPLAVHVQAQPVSGAGKLSVTVAGDAAEGPALLATIVYVSVPPSTTVATPSVLVIARSALAASVSVSVAALLPGDVSVTPAGAATVAVLASVPVAAASIVHAAVYVTLPPVGRFAVSAMLPLPDAVQVPPPAPAHVHVQVSDAGNVSAIVEPGALLGPALLAVIVYVTLPPGVAEVTPSVLVIERSALAPSASTSVAELLAGFGSVVAEVTVAVFVSEPVAAAEIVQLAV
jgi:hypothetical protein